MLMARIVSFALQFACVCAVASGADNIADFQAARNLEQADKPQEAFLAYAAILGGQHLAVRIGRAKPAEYRALLQSQEGKIPAPLARVVEGDLRLAEGDKPAALACYRAAAGMAATKDDQSWAVGHIPVDGYIVEPPQGREDFRFDGWPGQPMTTGPGSHRDNWLIRRFITLEAWDDAAAEFARVWEIHRRNTRPYRVLVPVRVEGGKVVSEERLVRPIGFDSQGLQFALDYAFFLRKINRPQQALAEVLGMGQQQQRAFVPVIATAVRDPHLRPRATAVALLSMIDDDAVIAAIKPAAGDWDPYVRAVAALTLVRRGQSLPIAQVRELLDGQFSNFPFGADSSVSVLVDRHLVVEDLAARSDVAIFRLLLENRAQQLLGRIPRQE